MDDFFAGYTESDEDGQPANETAELAGQILAELYLAPHEISIARFAEACGVTRKHMSAIVNGHAAITAEMAARMAAVLGTTAQYWLNLQNAVDLYDAQERLATSENRPQLMPVFG
jgi:addiction module HigA family antidote